MIKGINKETFWKRIKSSEYIVSLKFDGKTNNMEMFCGRNGESLKPETMTDEDTICLFQLATYLNDALFSEVKKRGLLPEELLKR